MILFIDIGGTPANILEKKKYGLAIKNGTPKEKIVAILDPFDLSRKERTFEYNGKKIKLKIKSRNVNLNSEIEKVAVPEGLPFFGIMNVREIMNNLVKFFYPNLKTINLEEVLSKNKQIVYGILKKTKTPVRAICPSCNQFRRILLGENSMCCNVKDNEIIDSGKYIPQEGLLPVILFLCGYKTFSNDKEKSKKIKNIQKIIGFKGNPLVNYIKEEELVKLRKGDEMEETVKGFRDFTGKEALKREKIKEIITKKFKIYGFEPAETPIVEYEGFVKRNNTQDEVISDIFRLKDKGQRNLALRYEFTFQLKRLAKNKKLPYRRYQIGEVFRDEPVSSNRFRQFTQCDIDVVGSTIRDEAEVLKVFSEILEELKVKYKIEINNRKLLNEILENEKIKEKEQVIREIDKIDKLPEKEVRNNLKKLGAEKLIKIFKKPKSFFEKYSSYKEIEKLLNYCKKFNVKVKFSPSLARGLSYYSGSIFEIKLKNQKESIAGGGSYIINGIQSTGISFGLERLSSVDVKLEGIRCLVISINQDEKSIKLAQELRKQQISCFIMDKISKALDYANAMKIPYVIFVGERETKLEKFKLRDMKTGKESMLSEKELISVFKKA
ncbi:MAG: HisS family protein [Candidatus Pacearchaeota archaeon]